MGWTERERMLEVAVQFLLNSPIVTIRDVFCQGRCRHKSAEEWATTTELVFPYRGVYIRHLGHDEAVAEANQVLFFNASEAQLRELAPTAFLRDTAGIAFRRQRLRIDARTQALVALLRQRLRRNIAERLEAESMALTLVRRALGPRTTHA